MVILVNEALVKGQRNVVVQKRTVLLVDLALTGATDHRGQVEGQLFDKI